MTDDRDLRRAFHALRAELESRAPDFATLARRAVPARDGRRSRTALASGAALMAATLIAAILIASLPHRGVRPAPRGALSVMAWRSPTDFLLRTPALELMRSVPRIDLSPVPASAAPAAPAAPGRHPATLQAEKSS
jgi:hypothetical protein